MKCYRDHSRMAAPCLKWAWPHVPSMLLWAWSKFHTPQYKLMHCYYYYNEGIVDQAVVKKYTLIVLLQKKEKTEQQYMQTVANDEQISKTQNINNHKHYFQNNYSTVYEQVDSNPRLFRRQPACTHLFSASIVCVTRTSILQLSRVPKLPVPMHLHARRACG